MVDRSDEYVLTPEQTRMLREWDRRYVWHPFTQHALWNRCEPLVIVAGEREFLIDSEGRRYIDGVSSLWCNVLGHRHPRLDTAVREQLGRIAHSTLLGLTSPPAVRLARRLVELAPRGLEKVFFSDDGSTAVEVACKMAFAYWQHTGQTARTEFLSLREAYHGDTVGSVSVGGIDLFHKVFGPLLFACHHVASPNCYRCAVGRSAAECAMQCLDEVRRVLDERGERIAAVVVEPMVQCAGGILTAPTGYLAGLRRLCDAHGVLLIADEVATGFGRTGRMFACEHEDVSPDFLCLGKGLTGGYLPVAATLTTQRVYDAFLGAVDAGRTFYHGHTYTGNALGCAAAEATLDAIAEERVLEALPPKIEAMRDGLARIAGLDHVGDVRQCGLIAGIELVADTGTRQAFDYGMQVGAQVCARAWEKGVLIRPLADVVVLFPPLTIEMANLRRLMEVIEECLREVCGDLRDGVSDGYEG